MRDRGRVQISKARVQRLESLVDELEAACTQFCREGCRAGAQDGIGKAPECAVCVLQQFMLEDHDDDDDDDRIDSVQQAREALQQMRKEGVDTFASYSSHRRMGPGNLKPADKG